MIREIDPRYATPARGDAIDACLSVAPDGAGGIVATSIAASEGWVVGPPKTPRDPELGIVTRPAGGGIRRRLRTLPGLLEDALFLLLVVWLFAVIVLVLGAPVALLVRLASAMIKLL